MPTVMTKQTRNVVRDNNPITDFELTYTISDLDYLTSNLVTKDRWLLQRLESYFMNIRETNSAGFDPKQNVSVFKRRHWNLLET